MNVNRTPHSKYVSSIVRSWWHTHETAKKTKTIKREVWCNCQRVPVVRGEYFCGRHRQINPVKPEPKK